jgi:hypothetical protein
MILSLMNETLINPVNDTGSDVDALLFCKLLSYVYLSNAQTPLCIRHGITLASELECHSWSPLTRQHNNLESHKSMARGIMEMCGMQFIPTIYPVRSCDCSSSDYLQDCTELLDCRFSLHEFSHESRLVQEWICLSVTNA